MNQNHYDAFISYRHKAPDQVIAGTLQGLLEEYRPPKSVAGHRIEKIGRVFRDRTELPDSADLQESLNDALYASDYLIAVLSPEYQKSKYCMDEIRTFKKKNGQRTDRILPILVSGEPDESIPDVLRHQMKEVTDPDGTVHMEEVEVEPLCCDVRADSLRQSKKMLKTEFLRVAAPILGCSFDDLYRRHLRRRRQQLFTVFFSAFLLLGIVLALVSAFAYKTFVAEQKVRSNLVDTYARNGASQIALDDQEKSMMYYSDALSLNKETQAARTGALLLLQQCGWLNKEEQVPGMLLNGQIYNVEKKPLAVDSQGRQLWLSRDGEYFLGSEKTAVSSGELIACAENGSCLTFWEEEEIVFYFPDRDSKIRIPIPEKELDLR